MNRQRERLAKELLPIAAKQARLLSEQTKQPFEELFSVGCLAIAEVLKKADISRPGFHKYVKVWVSGYLFNYLRDKSRPVRVPRHLTNIYLKERSLAKKLPNYHNYSEVEQAQLIGISPELLRESRQAINLFTDSTDAEGFDNLATFNDVEEESEGAALTPAQEILARVLYIGSKTVADELCLPLDSVAELVKQGLSECQNLS